MNKWDDLPNAKHIDWVIASVRSDPRAWNAADAAAGPRAWTAAWTAARDATWYASRGVAWYAAWYAAQNAVLDAAKRGGATDAVYALVAWDDCAHILDMPADAVKTLASCGHHPAVLLYPAVLVKSNR